MNFFDPKFPFPMYNTNRIIALAPQKWYNFWTIGGGDNYSISSGGEALESISQAKSNMYGDDILPCTCSEHDCTKQSSFLVMVMFG